jgi:agmatinase
LAPPAIRRALFGDASNLWSERGRDLGQPNLLVDWGDVSCDGDERALVQIEEKVGNVLQTGARPLVLGGDHAITLGVLRALAKRTTNLNVLHIDAHPDLYESYNGNRFSHACPFARALEEGLISRLVQVGIRTMNGEQRRQVSRYGVEVIEAWAYEKTASLTFSGPIYVSLDLDGLDPAYAPGVSHHEPGGLTTRQVLTLFDRLSGPLVGADIVEYNPSRDVHEMTAQVAAKFVKELACRMLGPIH